MQKNHVLEGYEPCSQKTSNFHARRVIVTCFLGAKSWILEHEADAHCVCCRQIQWSRHFDKFSTTFRLFFVCFFIRKENTFPGQASQDSWKRWCSSVNASLGFTSSERTHKWEHQCPSVTMSVCSHVRLKRPSNHLQHRFVEDPSDRTSVHFQAVNERKLHRVDLYEARDDVKSSASRGELSRSEKQNWDRLLQLGSVSMCTHGRPRLMKKRREPKEKNKTDVPGWTTPWPKRRSFLQVHVRLFEWRWIFIADVFSELSLTVDYVILLGTRRQVNWTQPVAIT